jgi:hypothetical protein
MYNEFVSKLKKVGFKNGEKQPKCSKNDDFSSNDNSFNDCDGADA